MTSKEALQILNAAGIFARQQKAPYGTCRTCCYRVNGQPVNLGRLRQMAAEAQSPS
jgi:hypothetical protein